jgi:hypothetical protein
MSVRLTTLSPNATEDDIRNFLGYCGDIARVVFEDSPTDGRAAVVTFKDDEAPGTAVLLTGAILVDRPVTITALESADRTSTQDALAFIEEVVSKGVVTGEAIISTMKAKALALDREHGVVTVVAGGAKGAVKTVAKGVGGVVGVVAGSEPKVRGQPTNQQWMYGSQPQWGPPPPALTGQQ